MKSSQFKFTIRSCKKNSKGILVSGKVIQGILTEYDEVQVLCFSEFVDDAELVNATVSKIYYDGKELEKCTKGQVVSLLLLGVQYNQIRKNVSYITSIQKRRENIISIEGVSAKKTPIKTSDNEPVSNAKLVNSASQCNSIEKQFSSCVLRCIKANDGVIGPTELYIIDKIRIALSVSVERAKELIDQLLLEFKNNRDRTLYRDAVALCLLDGSYISNNERLLLNSLREILNITDRDAYEIEDSVKI